MTYTPDHLNQFSRFPPAEAPYWGPTVWPDGTAVNYNGGNCWATVAAMMMRWTLQGEYAHPRVPGAFECTGLEPPTPPRVRYWSGNHESAGRITDVMRAAKHWRADLTPAYGMSLGELRYRVVVLKQLVGVCTDYEFIKDLWSCQRTFDGGHALLVREIGTFDFEGKGGLGKVDAVRVSDPLCDYIKWVPWAQFERACSAYSKWDGHVTAYVAPTREDIMAVYGFDRSRVADVKRGAVLRTEPDGEAFATLGAIARDIPVVGTTKGGQWVALGLTKVDGRPVNRILWTENERIASYGSVQQLDEAAIRADEQAKAAVATSKAVEAARAEEQKKLEPIVAARTEDLQRQAQASRAAFEDLKRKVVDRLAADGADAAAFLADVSDDTIPAAPQP